MTTDTPPPSAAPPSKTALIAASILAALAVATPISKQLEGEKYVGYADGNNVGTICNGSTKHLDGRPVKVGDIATPEMCEEMTKTDLSYAASFVAKNTFVSLSPYQFAGLILFTNNVGVGNYYKSTARRLINQGDFRNGCHALTRYVFVGDMDCRLSRNKRVCGGIPLRREREKQLCLKVK